MFRASSASDQTAPARQAMERFFDWDYDLYEAPRRRARIAWIITG